jgi:hypothetical protein
MKTKNTYVLIISILVIIHTQLFAIELKRTPSDAADNKHFGQSCAIDDTIMVIGAQGDNSRTGAVYIFYRNFGGPDNWGQVAKVIADDGNSNDRFGVSVALDDTILVVGSSRNDEAGADAGAAYIFYKNSGGTNNWGQVQKLMASDGGDGDFFGVGVDISDTVVVVGSEFEDLPAATDAGAAYVFYKNTGGADNWGQHTKLTASDFAASAFYGHSVAISGIHIVVGAWNDEGTTGAAYIYGKNNGGTDNWGEVIKLLPDNIAVNEFGNAVDIDGDYLVAAAPRDDSTATSSGAIYVFFRHQGGANNWGVQQKLKASDAASDDILGGITDGGKAVSIKGPYIMAGAIKESSGTNTEQGAVYSFLRSGSTWSEVSKEIADDAVDFDWFGFSVAVGLDFGVSTTPLNVYSGLTAEAGAAYIYDTGTDLALPVFLDSFNAILSDNGVILSWITQSEIENMGFEIYRSEKLNGIFEKISSYHTDDGLKGKIYSNIEAQYSYTDHAIERGKEYYYKLVDVSIKGARSEHGPIKISTTEQKPENLTLLKSYPNPFNPSTTIRVDAAGLDLTDEVEILIYNSLGQKVKSIYRGVLSNGLYLYNWNANNDFGQTVTSGVYFIVLQNLNTSQVIQHKITYIK